MPRTSSSTGFTLIEILVSLAVLAVISTLGVASLVHVNTSEALTVETEKVLTLLTKARSFTLAAKDGSAYGVHFEERKAVLFKGPVYSVGASANHTQTLNNAVKISVITLAGGGADVVFAKLSGATAQSGTLTLAAVRDASKTKMITIAATGVAYGD